MTDFPSGSRASAAVVALKQIDIRNPQSTAPAPEASVRVAPVDDASVPRRAQVGRQVDRLYGAFLKMHQAKGGDAEKFRSLLMERQMIIDDIIMAAKAQGINVMNREAYKPVGELVRKSVSEFNLETRAAVGEQAYTAWVDFEKMKGEFNVGMELAGRLQGTGSELTDEQQAIFVKALFELKEPSGWKNVKSVLDQDGEPTLVRVIPDTAIDRMRTILNPQQMAKFFDLYQEQKRGAFGGGR